MSLQGLPVLEEAHLQTQFSNTVDLIQLSHCLCRIMGLSLADLEQSYLKEARCFLKYTVPMRRIKLRNPGSRVVSHVSARLPIDVVLMNFAC